jgi:APA family basic amino acid/polyamine antiporter
MLTTLGPVTNEAPGLPDAVVTGLAAMMGAGLLLGIAPAAEAAGFLVLVALPIAALVVVLCGLSTSESKRPLPRAVAMLGRSAGAAAVAVTFGRYVLPQQPKVAAALVLVFAILLVTFFDFTPPRSLLRAAVVVQLAVLAVFVAACFAIEPPPNPPGATHPEGLPVATAFLVFGFLGADRRLRDRGQRIVAVGVALLIYLAVTGAALYQLGAARLGLSPVPLRDALAAADASGIGPVLTVGAALATALALLGVLTDIYADEKPVEWTISEFVMVGGIMLVAVPVLIIVAVALMIGHRVLVTSTRGSARRPPRSRRP